MSNSKKSNKTPQVGGFKLTLHALERLEERDIKLEWIQEVLDAPVAIKEVSVNEWHYLKPISDCDQRALRVIVNPISKKIITVFWDRRFIHEDFLR